MKKTTVMVILLVSCIATSFAQTRADRTFSIPEKYIYNTHTAYLPAGERIVFEMADVTDYLLIKNLDSIVRLLVSDISFYSDSFKALENVRIDYALEKDSDKTMLRFRKYQPNGDIYVKKNTELSRMKMEQDTIRIIVRTPLLEHNSHMSFNDYPLQVTFLLNNYASSINTILNDKGLLNHLVDTFSVTSFPKVYNHRVSEHGTTISYYPYKASKLLYMNRLDEADDRQASLRKK